MKFYESDLEDSGLTPDEVQRVLNVLNSLTDEQKEVVEIYGRARNQNGYWFGFDAARES